MRFESVLGRWRGRELSQAEAAEHLGMSERSFRRWREHYEEEGLDGLLDRRLGKASAKRVPVAVAFIMEMAISAIMYMAERTANAEQFGSLPKALWWGLMTLTMVGSDQTPVTALGTTMAAVAAVRGIALFAFPAGILASGFSDELARRKFTVTWDLVATVPLFTGLSAVQISRIASLLKFRLADSEEELVRKGDPGDSMFFVIRATVEVATPQGPVVLHEGQFFGEVSLIKSGVRTSTVTARSACALLVLEGEEFRSLIREIPDIETNVRKVTAERGL